MDCSTVFSFLTTNVCFLSLIRQYTNLTRLGRFQVIHVQVLKFKTAFKEAKSLDEMTKLHNDQ